VGGLAIDSKLLVKLVESLKPVNFDVRMVNLEVPYNRHEGTVGLCVLPLNQTTVILLRNSGWFAPRRTLIYGIGDWSDAAQFNDLGINALLEKPTDLGFRTAVSTTQSVIGCGISPHARVPIVIRVNINAEGFAMEGITRNVGPGGMAVTLARSVSLPNVVNVSFALPGGPQLCLPASPRWYSGLLVGLRYHRSSKVLRKWISRYSHLGK
jgi:PilZ domain